MSDRGNGRLTKLETEEEDMERLFVGIMEGYNDSVIPPLSYFSPSEGILGSSNKRQKTRASTAESKLKERLRRDEMSEKYSVLQSMVPSLQKTYKYPREEILSDAIKYIRHLEAEIQMLEGLKKLPRGPNEENPVLSNCLRHNSSAKVEVSNDATFLATQRPSRRGLVREIVQVFEKHRAEILEARVCIDDQHLLTFTATVKLGCDGGGSIDKIKEEILAL